MNIFQAFVTALRKIKFSKGKSLFVIIPISLMFAIIVIAASEAYNLIQVAHNSIFSPIEGQNEVIELNKTNTNMREILNNAGTTGYTSTDNSLVSTIANIESTNLVSVLPITPIKTSDLFTDNTISITSLAGLDEQFAKLYTNNSFSYYGTDNGPIPIILNANDFTEVYEDWQGKTEIAIDFTANADPGKIDTLATQTPVKTRAISYSRDQLIGKVITINFGGLDKIYNIKQESTATGYKYTQKTAAEITAETEAMKTAVSKYWDYDKISLPLSYEFVIVGISEGTDKTKTFIPLAFANQLMQNFLANQVSARNTTAIPTADQNSTYLGLVYDGVTLQNDTNSTIYAGIRNQVNNQVAQQFDTVNNQINSQNNSINSQNNAIRNFNNQQSAQERAQNRPRVSGEPPLQFTFNRLNMSTLSTIQNLSASSIKISYPGSAVSYTIPGLVYAKDRTTSELTGENTTLATTASVPVTSSTILIKINDIANRDSVVTALNSKGYNYQDFSQYKQYNQLENYLNLALKVGAIIFMAVTALFILINMAKFVSEGRKEIGIFRAIGATKGDIRLLFILQSLSYIVISILLGALVGGVATIGMSTWMAATAQSIINSAVGSTVTLYGSITSSNFMNFDYKMILIYSGLLLIVTLIVSLIPSGQAAKVSPVEAIRN